MRCLRSWQVRATVDTPSSQELSIAGAAICPGKPHELPTRNTGAATHRFWHRATYRVSALRIRGDSETLDFTATRPAVGLVSRCEALTRALGTLLVAVEDFHILCPDNAQPLGVHTTRGFENGIDLFTYPL